ncbi:MAG: hypothetical protein QOJ88_638 [Pyrinomonadaceae bacterium]|jgi:hypothetical protein|nr:hypothetical protein [Pyrinomonadaceae bacterium]
MTGELATPLRERAMETLQESTVMLKVACNLIEQGNRKEAERLKNLARAKREVSVMLMAQAKALENGARDEFTGTVAENQYRRN